MSSIDSTPFPRPSQQGRPKSARKSRTGSPRHDSRNEESAQRELAKIRAALEDYQARIRAAEDFLRSEGVLLAGKIEELTRLWNLDANDGFGGAAL